MGGTGGDAMGPVAYTHLFVQRKKKQLIPTEKGKNLIAVLPDNIKSPILTAEWESMRCV